MTIRNAVVALTIIGSMLIAYANAADGKTAQVTFFIGLALLVAVAEWR